MKNIIFALLIHFIGIPSSMAEESLVKILLVKGAPQVVRGQSVFTLDKSTSLINGDIIRTEEKELVILKTPASTYKISEKTFLKLDLKEPQIIQSHLAWGSVVVQFSKNMLKGNAKEGEKKLNIKTKAVSIGVRGTTLFANAIKNGGTTTSVEHGNVELGESKKKAVPVTDGQSVMASGSNALKEAKPLGFEKHINWKLSGKSSELEHPAALFKSIQKKWDNYKKENKKTWDSFKGDMNKGWKGLNK